MCFSVNPFLSVSGCVFCKSQTPLYSCEQDTAAVLSDIKSGFLCSKNRKANRMERKLGWSLIIVDIIYFEIIFMLKAALGMERWPSC